MKPTNSSLAAELKVVMQLKTVLAMPFEYSQKKTTTVAMYNCHRQWTNGLVYTFQVMWLT